MIDRDVEEWLRISVASAATERERVRDAKLRALLLEVYKPRRGPLVMGGPW